MSGQLFCNGPIGRNSGKESGHSCEKRLFCFQLWEAARPRLTHSPPTILSLPFCHIAFRDNLASLLVGPESRETMYVNALQTVNCYEIHSTVITTMMPTLNYTREPLGGRGCCLPSPQPCPAPSLLTESQLYSGSRWLGLVPRSDHDWSKGVVEILSLLCCFEKSMWTDSHLWHLKGSTAMNGGRPLWWDIPPWCKERALGGKTLLLLPAPVLPSKDLVLGTATTFWHPKGKAKSSTEGLIQGPDLVEPVHSPPLEMPASRFPVMCHLLKKKKIRYSFTERHNGEKHGQGERVLASKFASWPSCLHPLCFIVGHSENYNS